MNIFENDCRKEKILNNYNKFGTLYIGVDFDDTIRDFETGAIINPVFEELLKCNNIEGIKLCLYTSREGNELVYALNFCSFIGLKIDYVNYSPLSPGLRKPLFNLLLDDRSGLVESLELLKQILNEIRKQENIFCMSRNL